MEKGHRYKVGSLVGLYLYKKHGMIKNGVEYEIYGGGVLDIEKEVVQYMRDMSEYTGDEVESYQKGSGNLSPYCVGIKNGTLQKELWDIMYTKVLEPKQALDVYELNVGRIVEYAKENKQFREGLINVLNHDESFGEDRGMKINNEEERKVWGIIE